MVLKIGISYDPSTDLFLSGTNQTAITLGQVLLKLGHNIALIDIKSGLSGNTWWDGINRIPEFELVGLHNAKGFDLFIDIDGYVLPAIRQKIAANSIVFLRTFLQFSELDNSVYPELPYRPRDLSGVGEVWCWDILNPVETLPSIQTIFPCPIRRVPFTWSQWIATEYIGGKHAQPIRSDGAWNVYICEKNNCNSSSCILPIVAVRELVLGNVIKAKYKCYNTDKLKENRFFKENVYNNIQIGTEHLDFYSDDGGEFHKMLDVGGSILFSHSRFMPIRIGLLNALWMGLPIIHNSPVLRGLHPILNEMFYTGNNIKEICSRFNWFCNGDGSTRYYSDELVKEIRQSILKFCGIDQKHGEWCEFMQTVNLKKKAVPPVVSLSPQSASASASASAPERLIAFSDMWPGFNYNSNFIMNALRNEICELKLGVKLLGVNYQELGTNVHPDLVIFGPYSNEWKSIPDSIPKVFFSAENWDTPSHPSIRLWLTASKSESSDKMRIPTWMTFIDWFSGRTELPSGAMCEDNPILMPLSLAMRSHPVGFKERSEFCGFVVSNPICEFRNETFKAIDTYKRVNSGGALYNNIGGKLSLRYAGGGCGDISKYNFFEKHRFTISFENSQAPGYITEKVLHSKMAGCVPLYWGDVDADSDFVPGSIVNLSKIRSPEAVLEILKKLEENPELCAKIASTPILNEEKKLKALNIMSNMSRKILDIINIKTDRVSEMPHKIKETFIINLDTRKDRWDELIKAEPYLGDISTRIPAVNGKTLKMNDVIYRLFSKNQFKWKKSVIGCNLSHIATWSKICGDSAAELDDMFLVLEDDVRFTKGWRDIWRAAAEKIPADAELLYLGGVLPPNKSGLVHCQEHVNEYWSQIKPNTFFSPVPLPIFHFCAYSYILTKRGAQKIIKYLAESDQKSYTVSDHLLGSPHVGLKKYFMNPFVSYCFQEDDPVYINSNFNDLHRKDTFDSDIWNNTECFTEDEIAEFSKETVTFYRYSDTGEGSGDLYESQWIRSLFEGLRVSFKEFSSFDFLPPNNAWFIVQRPYIALWNEYFKRLVDNNISFKVLHLSDEFSADDISFYNLAHCKAILRNYLRPDAPDSEKVLTIPLGFHHAFNKSVQKSDGALKDRKLLWSFHGTGWFGRKEILEGLSDLAPHSCHITPDWNHSTMTREADYVRILSNTRFVPILRGNNVETFRLYEALEAGCVPIYVGGNAEYDKAYSAWLKENLGLIDSVNWVAAKKYMSLPEDKYGAVENYRGVLLDNWRKWKERIKRQIIDIL